MKITVCDICGKPLESPTTIKLPYKNKYNIMNYGKVVGAFEKDLHLEDYDLCEDCLEQIYDFIKILKENSNDSL